MLTPEVDPMIKLIVILSASIALTACKAQRIAHPLGSSPASILICTLYEEDAYSAAQRHCEKHGYNAELVRHSWTTFEGLCSIPDHLGILKAPTKFNFRCVKK